MYGRWCSVHGHTPCMNIKTNPDCIRYGELYGDEETDETE